MSTDHRSDVYFKVYTAQKGGELPPFRGTRRIQYGSGFGDILRSINRHVLPVTAERSSAIAPSSKPIIDAPDQAKPEAGKDKRAMSGTGKRKKKNKKKISSKKKSVYKGKKRGGKRGKITETEASSKIPNFNF